MCSTGLAGIMLLNYQRDYTVWVLPLIIVCLFAFLVAHCFLSIYEMVVDVLFLCFAIDTKYNDGSPGKEFYMDKVLMVRSFYITALSEVGGIINGKKILAQWLQNVVFLRSPVLKCLLVYLMYLFVFIPHHVKSYLTSFQRYFFLSL